LLPPTLDRKLVIEIAISSALLDRRMLPFTPKQA